MYNSYMGSKPGQSAMTESRFWAKVAKKDEGCWLWRGSVGGNGYGRIGINFARVPAHRQAWIYTNGPISPALECCHKCDVPLCVRPDHLFLGTHADNMKDKMDKGRFVLGARHSGEKHHNCHLTDAQVAEIRRLYSEGVRPQQKIADMFGTAQAVVSSIVLGKSRAKPTV